MLKLAPKTEQDSNGTFHQGAFLLPRWPPGHLKAHICFDRCGFFCSLLSIKKSFRIGGSQIEENENPSNSAASGAGYPVQAQAFAAQSGLQRLPVCDDVHDILPAGLCGNRCMDQGQRDHAGCIHPNPCHLHYRRHRHCFGIIVDIFNSAVYKNANMSILGTSGAGKTFTMQLMALRMRRKNIPIFIVAPLKGHEFHRACSNVGGSFIQISPASPHCINVMEIRRVDRSVNEILDGPGIQLSELAAKIQQLHIFFSLLIPDMSHEERQLLDEALVRTYNTKGITHDNASLEDPAQPGQYREMPVLGDLYEILKTSKETMRMAHILNRLVNGSASTFNKQTNVRLDNKYTVLDISSLTGDLLTVGMFVALDFVWDRAKADRTEEKAIFIDECWQLLSGAGAAGVRLAGDFLLEIAKTIRGYGGASIFASQDLADFFDLDGGRFGKGIINNSKTKIILNLEDDEAQRVQEALHLSDAETMEITHFERGHGLISTNNNNIMVEFKASPLEKDLITTDRRELREIVERKRREQSTSAEQQI